LIAPRECPPSLQRIGFCIVHDVSLSPRRSGHRKIDLAATELGTYQSFAPTENQNVRAVSSSHLGGVGLDLMLAGSALQNKPDLGRGSTPEHYRRATIGLQPRRHLLPAVAFVGTWTIPLGATARFA